MLIFWGVFYQPPPGELSPDFDRTKHQRKYRLFVACRMRTTSPVRSLEEPWKNSLPEDHGSQWVSSSRLKEDGWFLLLLLLLLLLFFSQIFCCWRSFFPKLPNSSWSMMSMSFLAMHRPRVAGRERLVMMRMDMGCCITLPSNSDDSPSEQCVALRIFTFEFDVCLALWLQKSVLDSSKSIMKIIWNVAPLKKTRWWFQTFFIFTSTWGDDPFWLIFFRWVETTN